MANQRTPFQIDMAKALARAANGQPDFRGWLANGVLRLKWWRPTEEEKAAIQLLANEYGLLTKATAPSRWAPNQPYPEEQAGVAVFIPPQHAKEEASH